LRPYEESSREMPAKHSRQKIFAMLKDPALEGVTPVPHRTVTASLYKLFMKIGATNELPVETALQVSFLNDFWNTM